ncbi:MAG: hypothetical protein HY901_01150 [Deltaproteobacteria bacterium]|nr:hypothetical protein [Deltaproteobacteria bacterium]
MFRVLSIGLSVLILGCAAQKLETKEVKLETDPSKTQTLSILGAGYVFPGHLNVRNIESVPGTTKMEFTDAITACEGTGHFESVSDPKAHAAFISNLVAQFEKGIAGQPVKVQKKNDRLPMLGGSVRLTSLVLSADEDGSTGMFAVLDGHYPNDTLSVFFTVMCGDPALAKRTFESLISAVNTQKKY